MFDRPARALSHAVPRCAVRDVPIRRRQRLPGARGPGCRRGGGVVSAFDGLTTAGLSAFDGPSYAAVSGGALGLVAWGAPPADVDRRAVLRAGPAQACSTAEPCLIASGVCSSHRWARAEIWLVVIKSLSDGVGSAASRG